VFDSVSHVVNVITSRPRRAATTVYFISTIVTELNECSKSLAVTYAQLQQCRDQSVNALQSKPGAGEVA